MAVKKSKVNNNFEALKRQVQQQKRSAEVVDNPVDNRVDNRVDNLVDSRVDNPVDSRVDSPVDSPVDNRVDNRVDNPVDTKLKLNKKEKQLTKKATYYLPIEIASQMEQYAKQLGVTGSELASTLLSYALGALQIE